MEQDANDYGPSTNAADHYTSAARHDYVKRAWERPQFCEIVRAAVQRLCPRGANPLVIADLGAGVGEGFDLCRSVLLGSDNVRSCRYIAIDRSAEMLGLCKSHIDLCANSALSSEFVQLDLRDVEWSEYGADLLISVGVPLSHLLEEDLCDLIVRVASTAARKGKVVMILDVLARYSIEWTPRWGDRRWEYAMSFFSGSGAPPHDLMTFYSADDLRQVIQRVAPLYAPARLTNSWFWDRSVFVGRHTMTAQYNPGIPRFRDTVNWISGVKQVSPRDLDRLLIPSNLLHAGMDELPVAVWRRLARCQRLWNGRIELERHNATSGELLCDRLRRVDQLAPGRGVGVGHSLTAMLEFTGQ